MPVNVTASNGSVFHLWQLGNDSAPEPQDSIAFTTFENELAEGYRSSAIFGLNTGVKSWSLTLPTLAGSSVIAAAKVDPYGATVSREQYLRNLYRYNVTTGTPFAYQDTNNDQYYLVDFMADPLTMQRRKGVNIYSTNVKFRQRRLNGVTIFDVNETFSGGKSAFAWLKGADYQDGSENWAAAAGFSMSGAGDVNEVAAAQNGHNIVRFSNTTNDGFVFNSTSGSTLYDVFIVMKMREATFSNNAGILTGDGATDPQILTGASGTTKFTNPGLSATAFTYLLNGVEYAQSNMQAPMDAWGIVQARYTTGWNLNGGYQFGKNRTTAATFAEMDIGEIVAYASSPASRDIARELTEHLAVKWGITLT